MSSSLRIDPTKDLAHLLPTVEKPARYVGGEWGAIVKDDPALFRVALSFPDLYEIGMSNLAIKLLYGALNARPGIAAERVFAPAPDFERLLRTAAIPLYTLETGTPLGKCDVLAVSFGYELLATNVLTLLSAGDIAIKRGDRGEGAPIVIAGGPGVTNPRPMSAFVDAFFIGEAEEEVPELFDELATARRRGASRSDLLAMLSEHPAVWSPGGGKRARRAIWRSFGAGGSSVDGVPNAYGAGFPVPSMRVVQDHGVTEIMRGCPQGCRFCHAGSYYRPYRMKSIDAIVREVDWLVHRLGYREITLSSLSSGDYAAIYELMDRLNSRYRGMGVSFQLPSLRVDSFTLPLLEQMSVVKRSALTFAVESPDEAAQRAVNKLVPVDRVAEILTTAKDHGWKHAKLYFMIGLPVPDAEADVERIAEYLALLRSRVKIEYVVNVGTFIPKPHTPFQWEAQLDHRDAEERIQRLIKAAPRGVTVRSHDPWLSRLEGILARGDDRTSEAIAYAHERGARLDAWSEYVKRKVWEEALDAVPGADRGLYAFGTEDRLPWDDVVLGTTRHALLEELRRSGEGETTERCEPTCRLPCGVCNRDIRPIHVPGERKAVETQDAGADDSSQGSASGLESVTTGVDSSSVQLGEGRGRRHHLLAWYTRMGPAAYLSHLSMVRVFERIWNRLGIPIELTSGYSPKARMSFGQPLPSGVESEYDLVTVVLQKNIPLEMISERFPQVAPVGIGLNGLLFIHHENNSPRIPSPMQRYGGSVYRVRGGGGTERLLATSVSTDGISVDRADDGVSFLRFSSVAPGLGRLINRESGEASQITRTLMWDVESEQPLFDWYTSRADAVWRSGDALGGVIP